MVYKMRKRKQKRIYLTYSSNSSSEDESHDSSFSDPDYTRTMPQRRSRRNGDVNSCTPMQAATRAAVEEAAAAGNIGNSSRNGAVGTRRRGRPLKFNNNNAEEGSRARQTDRFQARPTRGRRSSKQLQRRRTNSNATSGEAQASEKTILSWLIDKAIIEENEQVWYMDPQRRAVLQEGKITRAGVLCCCCYKVISVYEFEDHAERSELKKPYENIYLLRLQSSLLSYMIKAWNREDEVARRGFNLIQPQRNAKDRSDDACMICADGGDLICCERCPSTFHPSCVDMENIPQGDWLCYFCICKYCGGSSSDIYPLLGMCLLCEKKYHWECVVGSNQLDLNCSNVFCGSSCGETFKKLQKMVGVRNELDNGYSWTLLRRSTSQAFPAGPNISVKGTASDVHKMVENNCKIAVAWTVMDEFFLPNFDRHTKINVLQSVVYNRGSNLKRINFRYFFTAVLEKNDEIISAASIRVHGNKVAEMPFVGTREKYRGKGMLQKLLTAIESALCFLKVENLVIPSVPELVQMWTQKYRFFPIDNTLMKDLASFNTLMFPTAVRLQKFLVANAIKPAAAVTAPAIEIHEVMNNEADNNPNRDDNPAKLALPDLNVEPSED